MFAFSRKVFAEALVARAEQLGMRLGLACGVALALAPTLGWVVLVWLACLAVCQFGERVFVVSGHRHGRLEDRAGWGLAIITVNNLMFGSIAIAAIHTGEHWTMLAGVMILSGILMNAGPSARSSRAAYIAAAAPIAALACTLPWTAVQMGATWPGMWSVSWSVVLLLATSWSLRGFTVRVLDAERHANASKSAFLAMMSHEIRIPLNGVLGMAQAMAVDPLTDEQRSRLSVITRSGETLLAILNDVLDLAKIEAGKIELETVEFDLAELCASVHRNFEPLAAAKNLPFRLEVEEQARGVYSGDPGRLRQVLSNLVSNALKFTERGEVRLDVRAEPRPGGHPLVEFRVSDTGTGIPTSRLETLFTPFEQVDASVTRRFGGTGLGLAIVRDLVQLMGGTVDVTSVEGHGSKFVVRAALERLRPEDAIVDGEVTDEHPAEFSRSLRVLAAEDNPVNQIVLLTLLTQLGVEPVMVSDGAAALEAWRAEPWDLILMDVQMPVMDGVTAMRAIRSAEQASQRLRTPILALTADVMSHHVAEYTAAGADGYVAKPISVAALVTAMEAACSPYPCEAASEGPTDRAAA
ncbi:MAG: response regulator [Phenylobacterium sp.]|uniref:ATP-binding protein n=1 Tax=Phenylobacterium sp. TaxID=1871053 RepID=UPI001B571BFA|nr:ATP-binding protein [Phenylobacterium sp.]MBP7817828.1 response regulator [Phenylobacterium sp.]